MYSSLVFFIILACIEYIYAHHLCKLETLEAQGDRAKFKSISSWPPGIVIEMSWSAYCWRWRFIMDRNLYR